MAGRRTAARAEREEAAPSKNTNSFESTKEGQARPNHYVGENKGPKGEQTSTRAAHTQGRKAINTRKKWPNTPAIEGRARNRCASPARRSGAQRKHKQTKQKHDPSHNNMYPLHRKRRREETSAKLTSKQKGAGRRTAARAKREEAAPGEKANNCTSANMS